MRFLKGATPTLLVLLAAGCNLKPEDPKPLPAAPSIQSFAADKTRIEPGESVKLTFAALNATSAELTDASGTHIALDGDANSGSATVSPKATTFFLLRVKGAGGTDTEFVQVAVGEDLRTTFLVAVPPEIDSGGSSVLLWSAPDAKSVDLVD